MLTTAVWAAWRSVGVLQRLELYRSIGLCRVEKCRLTCLMWLQLAYQARFLVLRRMLFLTGIRLLRHLCVAGR